MKKILLGVLIGLALPLVILWLRASPTVEKFENMKLLRFVHSDLIRIAERDGEFPKELDLESASLQASKRSVRNRFIQSFRSGNVRYDPVREVPLFDGEGEILRSSAERLLIEWRIGESKYTCSVEGMVLVDGKPGFDRNHK